MVAARNLRLSSRRRRSSSDLSPALGSAPASITPPPSWPTAGCWWSAVGGCASRRLTAAATRDEFRDAVVYEPQGDRWVPAGEMAVARLRHSATLMSDGRVLVVGGLNRDKTAAMSAEIFDPTKYFLEGRQRFHQWPRRASGRGARRRHRAGRRRDDQLPRCVRARRNLRPAQRRMAAGRLQWSAPLVWSLVDLADGRAGAGCGRLQPDRRRLRRVLSCSIRKARAGRAPG